MEHSQIELLVSATGQPRPLSNAGPTVPVRPAEFGMVGVFDIDWLPEPRFTRLLDTMAASPGAFRAVRFFGALSSGSHERTLPRDSGIVWPGPDAPMDFSRTFDALEQLTARGLTPFVVLSFFPRAVSPSPVVPPGSFDTWQHLVRGFLNALVADPRFGQAAIREWWFEVWNEPNLAWFWEGSFARYLDFYRATAEAVVASGHDVRLGGPTLAYLGADAGESIGPPLMERFLRFLSAEPSVKCDFISLHAKGSWGDDEPDLRRTLGAVEQTAAMALRIDPQRFRGMPIINNEADMKVGFDIPFEPRMTEQFPAWLAAVMVASDGLSARFANAGFRFHAASDNANQHLIQAPFDGRRSLMTPISASDTDLVKVPVFNFYETVRLLGDRRGTVVRGGEHCFPNTDLFHLSTIAESHIASLLCVYPRAPDEPPRSWEVRYTLTDLPWPVVNVARFQIDRTHANAYTAAGRALSASIPSTSVRAIRQAQELAEAAPIRRRIPLSDGAFNEIARIDPFTVTVYWITPAIPDAPAAPTWIQATAEGENVILRWQPNREPFFYTYEVYRMRDDQIAERISPLPLRSAIWVDTAPGGGSHTYSVCAVSASGVESALITIGIVTP